MEGSKRYNSRDGLSARKRHYCGWPSWVGGLNVEVLSKEGRITIDSWNIEPSMLQASNTHEVHLRLT